MKDSLKTLAWLAIVIGSPLICLWAVWLVIQHVSGVS